MPRRRTVTDRDVLAAAARALAQVGPHKLTLVDVSRQAGLAAPTLIQRFGSKRRLLLAVAAAGVHQVQADFAAARAAEASPLAALHLALHTLVAGIHTVEVMAHHVAFLQLDLSEPDFRAHARAQAAAFVSTFEDLLDAAVSAGELDTHDVQRLARALYVAYNGALISWAIDSHGLSLAESLRSDVETVLAPYRREPLR